MPNHTFDLYLIQSATQRAKEYARDTVNRVQRYIVEDKDRAVRLSEHNCKWCWYRRAGLVAGQAITTYTCWRCDGEFAHGNTAVPRLCVKCAIETGLCSTCCGDVEGKQRTEVP